MVPSGNSSRWRTVIVHDLGGPVFARFGSPLLGGLIAGFIFMFISNLTGADPKWSAWWGLALLALGAVITVVIRVARRGRTSA